MSVLILSCGRTGTNLLLEIMRGSSHLSATEEPEDAFLFRRPRRLSEKYLSKCDTYYIDGNEQVANILEKNPELKVLWTIRNIKDMIMSKIVRGQPNQDGNQTMADDATMKGCVEDICHMFEIYQFINSNFPDRIKVVKMEDVILDFKNTIESICNFIGIPYEENMMNFEQRMRNKFKAQRYKGLDKSQIDLWKNIESYENGFFINHREYNLPLLFEKTEHIKKYFNYE